MDIISFIVNLPKGVSNRRCSFVFDIFEMQIFTHHTTIWYDAKTVNLM